MGRPKESNADLPPRLRFTHGAYYYADSRGGRSGWVHLGRDKDEALRAWRSIEGADDEFFADDITGNWIPALYLRSKAQAETRGIPYDLTIEELSALAKFSRNRCAITGIPFDFQTKVGNRRPYAPSLDRIDSNLGYSFQNCRLACIAANLALNDWGTTVFERLSRGYLESKGSIPRSLDSDEAKPGPTGPAGRSMQERIKRSKWRKQILTGELTDLYWANRLTVPERAIRIFREANGVVSRPATGPVEVTDEE